MTRAWLLGLALGCLAGPVHAASFGSAGTAGADFLKIPSDTRPAGMAGAVAATADGLEALEYNPALLTSVLGWNLSAQHLSYAEDISLEQLSLGWGHPGLGAGLSVLSLSTPDIPSTDSSGAVIGTFKQQDTAVSAGFGLAWGSLSLGLLGRGLQRSLAGYSYQGGEGDVGLAWRPWGGWRLGLAAQHLGSLGALSEEADASPLTFRGGLGWTHDDPEGLSFVGELDAVQPRDASVEARFGMEVGWSYFFARAGAQWSDDYEGRQPFTVGAGLRVSSWQLDYSFADLQGLGEAQRIGLSWRIGGAYGGRKGLQAPQGLAVKKDGADLVLTWKAAPDALGYAIYLRKGQDVDLLRSGTTKAGQTRLRLKKAAGLPLLGIAVSVLGEDGQESALSDELRVTAGKDQSEILRPTGLRLTTEGGKRILHWDGGTGPTLSYQILASRRRGSGYAPLGNPTVQLQKALPGADEWKETHYVVVQALRQNPEGQEASALSTELDVLPR
jgi:hypothetical protein